ncbi:MAG: FAD-dependent oxidoreductase [Bacteroidales bacterium]|nr:FAD-dependent oxidoreductase [Bacteroidales bacterium]
MKEFEIALEVKNELPQLPADDLLYNAAAKACGVAVSKVAAVKLVRRSLDARGKICMKYRLVAYLKGEPIPADYRFDYKDVSSAKPVTIIGGGPAGMFAALKLLELGLKPVLLERGKDVHARKHDIASIVRDKMVNPDSNFCFGEGGAGTFSDGKLYTRSSKRGDISEVLQQLVQFGASEQILYEAHPHIGSDRLPAIVEKIRECVVSHGGEYHFSSKVVDMKYSSAGWKVICEDGKCFSSDSVILATGHSARDIYSLFNSRGWALEAKGFALGVRVEHPQKLINKIQYHGRWTQALPPAEYSLVEQVDGRGVFSFCMCPGGVLVPSTTEANAIVLNGMSNSSRSSAWANAGIVTSVEPYDLPEFEKYGIFSLLEFQKSVESAMYAFSDSFAAPAQRMTDFCKSKISADLPRSSYAPGTISAPLHQLLPVAVADRLRKAFTLFDRKMHGYYTSDALLLGCESRTSSPVRIPRDPVTLQHQQLPGLYPCGEGAGYAGGIVSSALDGVACALRIASNT